MNSLKLVTVLCNNIELVKMVFCFQVMYFEDSFIVYCLPLFLCDFKHLTKSSKNITRSHMPLCGFTNCFLYCHLSLALFSL